MEKQQLQILKLLRKNSRISKAELAQKTDLRDVQKHMKKIKPFIKKFSCKFDNGKVGYPMRSIYFIETKKQQFITYLSNLANLNSLSITDQGILAELFFRSVADQHSFREGLDEYSFQEIEVLDFVTNEAFLS